jgi:acetylornithine/N-succinyldiaminopimelate aminotransferase
VKIGDYLKEKLNKEILKSFPSLIEEIRGKGLMLGIKPKVSNEIIIEQMRNEKILTVKASDNIIRLLPPLILQVSHVDEAIEKLKKALSKI